MFSGFSKAASDVLWELKFNNERPWFLAHKEQFEELVNTPFKTLARDTYDAYTARYPSGEYGLHISRIYRDARRLHGHGPYKDHLWFTIYPADMVEPRPCLWFEVGAEGFNFGTGMWAPTAAYMEAFRKAIDANPARFERIVTDMLSDGEFRVCGETYSRPKGDRGQVINQFYNRRHIDIECRNDFEGVLLSDRLPVFLADEFEKLTPMLEFTVEFMKGMDAAQR